MARFVLRRLVGMVAVLFAVSVLTFLIFNVIPNSDPAQRMAGRSASQAQIASIDREWGFDDPLPQQYLTMMGKVFGGDLISYTTREDVDERIVEGIPATVSLCLGAAVIWMFFGILFGYLSAVRAGGWLDRGLTVLAVTGISMPVFWLAAIFLNYLTYKTEIFPSGEYVELTADPFEWASHLILPWITLAILYAGFYSRVLRSSMLDVMSEDYVRTARAKGLSERQVMGRHVMRNSLIPIVTLFGLDFGALLGGCDPDRSALQPGRRRPVRLRIAEKPRSAADHGDRPLRRLLRRRLQHPGRHRLRLPRPADQAGDLGKWLASRCSRRATCGSASSPKAAACRRSTASPSTSRPARCWRSSASRARARASPRRRSSASPARPTRGSRARSSCAARS